MAQLLSEHIDVVDEFEAVQSLYLERGWTDGLPVVPPTPDRVETMLSATDLPPQHVLAELPPTWGAATVEKLAVNAVMADACRNTCLCSSPRWRPLATLPLTSTPSRPLPIHARP